MTRGSLPAWATNDLYTLGPQVGFFTKAPPTSGEIQEGWVPEERVPAELLNYLMSKQNDWIAALARFSVAPTLQLKSRADTGDHVSNCVATNEDQTITVSVGSGADGIESVISVSEDMGDTWTDVAAIPDLGGTATLDHVHYGDGVFVASGLRGASNLLIYTSFDGVSWAQDTLTPLEVGQYLSRGLYDVSTGTHLLLSPRTPNSTLYRSTDAITWSTVGLSGYLFDIATNGTQIVCVGVSAARYSSNGGATWNNGSMPAGTWTGVVYDASRGCYYAVDTLGKVARSVEGITWVVISTIPSFKARFIAVHKGVLVVPYFDAADPGGQPSALAVSVDEGATWFVTKATRQAPARPRANTKFIGDGESARLYVGSVWTGVVSSERF